MARACVLRQQVKALSLYGRKLKDKNILSYCQTGDCLPGKRVEKQLRGQQIEPARPVSMLAYWRAKKRAKGEAA